MTLVIHAEVVPAKLQAKLPASVPRDFVPVQHGCVDVYIRKNLYVNLVLSSGTNMVLEVVERMTFELTASAPFAMEIKVVVPPDDIILTAGAPQTVTSSLLTQNPSVCGSMFQHA